MSVRATTLIGAKAAQTSYYAQGHARRIGLPFTHVVTINYALTSVDPHQAVAAFSKLRRNHFNKWAGRPRDGAGPPVAPTYAFSFENARGGQAFMTMEPGDPHNVHVHWSVHVPAARFWDFKTSVWHWVEATTGGIIGGAETIHITPLGSQPNGYQIKGASPALLEVYGRGQKAEPQGIIIGRRADTSRNVGPRARRDMDRRLGIRRQMPCNQRAA